MSGKVSFNTAIAIVIANMIGTGVFTSLGYQVFGINSIFVLILLWIIGGIIALSGAFCYGELASLLPRSGGEYNYLSEIYHPSLGFLSGWASATVGFAAPIAAASMALGKYVGSVFPFINGMVPAILVVVVLTCIHAFDTKWAGVFQRYSTALKVIIIFLFIFCGFFAADHREITLVPQDGDLSLILSSSFFISLAYVSYSYSGWNASTYLAGDIENPKRNVPRSLFLGTLFVLVVYVLLNYIFLYTVPIPELRGKLEIGYLSAGKIFGGTGSKIMGSMIAFLLVSSISSMIFAGPRVTQVMGEDLPLLKKLAFRNKRGAPVFAVILQSSITILLILTSTFQAVVQSITFILNFFTVLTILGVFILRVRMPLAERKYKATLYPFTPLVFLLPTLWTMYILTKNLLEKYMKDFLLINGIVLLGIVFYLFDRWNEKRKIS